MKEENRRILTYKFYPLFCLDFSLVKEEQQKS
jgi:hypothetical protein